MSIFCFNHKDDENMEKGTLVAGDAKFKIIGTYDKNKDGTPLVDMAGNPKVKVSLSITDCERNNAALYETLTVNTGWKVKALLGALGLGNLYDKNGKLDLDVLQGGTGACTLKLQAAGNGFEARIVVDKYIKAEKQVEFAASNSVEIPNDDIPF